MVVRIDLVDMIVENGCELDWGVDVWNWSVGWGSGFNEDRGIVKDWWEYGLMYGKGLKFMNRELEGIGWDKREFWDECLVS